MGICETDGQGERCSLWLWNRQGQLCKVNLVGLTNSHVDCPDLHPLGSENSMGSKHGAGSKGPSEMSPGQGSLLHPQPQLSAICTDGPSLESQNVQGDRN